MYFVRLNVVYAFLHRIVRRLRVLLSFCQNAVPGTSGSNEEPGCKVAGDPLQTKSLGAQLGSIYPPGSCLNAPKCVPHQGHHEIVGGTEIISGHI